MKVLSLMTMCLVLAGTLFAATPANDEPADAEQKAPQQEKAADNSRQKKTAPATSFTPSEKVGADSAVSFPVDI